VLLGVTHAVEPDHLAAVSTLVTEQKKPWRGALVGAYWGLGHTAALLGVGVVLAVTESALPPLAEQIFEMIVALMLVVLGVRALRRAYQQGRAGPVVTHTHGGGVHAHESGGAHVHLGRWTLARRPFLVGLVHGLAGSGALTAMVLASLPSTAARLGYIALFGVGSMLGMAALAGLLGWPLAKASRHPKVLLALTTLAGIVSTVVGVYWATPLVGGWVSA